MTKSFFVANLMVLSVAVGSAVVVSAKAAIHRNPDAGVGVSHYLKGAGRVPTDQDVVAVRYRLAIEGRKHFEGFGTHIVPVVVTLEQAPDCWSLGLQTLAVGGQAVLTCPASNPKAARATYEVELLAIAKRSRT